MGWCPNLIPFPLINGAVCVWQQLTVEFLKHHRRRQGLHSHTHTLSVLVLACDFTPSVPPHVATLEHATLLRAGSALHSGGMTMTNAPQTHTHTHMCLASLSIAAYRPTQCRVHTLTRSPTHVRHAMVCLNTHSHSVNSLNSHPCVT